MFTEKMQLMTINQNSKPLLFLVFFCHIRDNRSYRTVFKHFHRMWMILQDDIRTPRQLYTAHLSDFAMYNDLFATIGS